MSGIQPAQEILGVQFAFRILEPYKEKVDKPDCVRRAILLLRNTVFFSTWQGIGNSDGIRGVLPSHFVAMSLLGLPQAITRAGSLLSLVYLIL